MLDDERLALKAVGTKLAPEDIKALEEHVRWAGRSRSEIVRGIIRDWLAKQKAA